MAKLENDLDIYLYYAGGNVNTQGQENKSQQLCRNIIIQCGS